MTTARQREKGFTIIELLIATTVFSVILLIVTTGIIKIGNIYYKGITTSRTQDAVRSISNDLTSTIQFANGTKVDKAAPPANPSSFCMGDVRYTYFPNIKYEKIKNNEFLSGLYSEDLNPGSNCVTCTIPSCTKDKRQLLGNNMRVLVLDVKKVTPSDQIWSVNLRIAYGDDDLLEANPNPALVNCKSGISGSSFCSVAQLDTIVKKRIQ